MFGVSCFLWSRSDDLCGVENLQIVTRTLSDLDREFEMAYEFPS